MLVVAGHARAFVFEDHTPGGGVLADLFYLATGLGHQAVIIFFAMSGYLVGGPAIRMLWFGTFAWVPYVARRLSRLWIVAIPALLLTLAFDTFGASLSGGKGYDGSYNALLSSGPGAQGLADSSVTFLGNVLFLQTVTVPVFGSNGPMWSLANEFWYYVFIPTALWVSLGIAQRRIRTIGIVALAAMVVLLPAAFIVGGFVWLAGAVAAVAAQDRRLKPLFEHNLARATTIVALPVGMVGAKLLSASSDLWFGLLVAAGLPVWAAMPSVSRVFNVISEHLAEMSFTLYLTHFPLLMFFSTVWLLPDQLALSTTGITTYAVLILAAFVYAWLVWWLFERHTNRVYRWAMARLDSGWLQQSVPRNEKQDT
ncbi:peptidoglycan/LPS O-acetylase OafA/YrhL [Rhodovulum marinum]|uniref:Peptidoglycan/LPS O-acetylase OafA/YrhL n=1 Tax=Rhodovulum marinum TaxID=320662 RepID=A0A4R2PVM9_9RHOB|nr:peptidoglycan/LPS O-acetylase OafA/YrhL [Rhodovulum marinum]